MDLVQEVKHRLRGTRPWSVVLEELEREANQVEVADERAEALYQLGEICEDFFLRKDRAMVHYQAAFKLNPRDGAALERARNIYREMGNREMVATLLGLELKVAGDPLRRAELQAELGLVHLDLGNVQKALPLLESALNVFPDDARLVEAHAAAVHNYETWADDVNQLTDEALASEPAHATELFVRIARILRIEVPGDPRAEEALRAALSYDSQNEDANALLESLLAEGKRYDEILQLHEERGEACSDEHSRALLNWSFASTWALRFEDFERAAYFYHKALVASYSDGAARFPGHLAAFTLLREFLGARGAWEELLQIADLALSGPLSDDDVVVLASQAGLVAWREVQDVERAGRYLARVQELDPDNEVLAGFIADIGSPGHDGAGDLPIAAGARAAGGESTLRRPLAGGQAEEGESDAPEASDLAPLDAEATVVAPAPQPAAMLANLEGGAAPDAASERGDDTLASLAALFDDANAGRRAQHPTSHEDVDRVAGSRPPVVGQAPGLPVVEEAPGLPVVAELAVAHEAAPDGARAGSSAAGDRPWSPPVAVVREVSRPHESANGGAGDPTPPVTGGSLAPPPPPGAAPASPEAKRARVAGQHEPAAAARTEAALASTSPSASPSRSGAPVAPAPAAVSGREAVQSTPVAVPAETTPAVAGDGPLPQPLVDAMAAARAAESTSPDKGVDAWRRVVVQNAPYKAPRAELARVLRAAEKWNLLVELLREQAEKLPGYTPDEKVEALFGLAAIYRERLRLDVQVVNALNGVLHLQPGNLKAIDALLAQLEHMKRWPDLISTLQKKAAAVENHDEQIALWSRVASLFQEKFSNVAEAIKAYEKVLDLDPRNGAAIAFLKGSYEKRRDWEKLVAVHQREIALIADHAQRSAKYIEVARLASEKLKKPAVSIGLWSSVLEASPDHPEALAELEKLYERERQWDKLAAVLERQAHSTSDVVKKVALLTKLGVLFTDRVVDPERAVEAWKGLLAVEPENKRAQDALKKLYTTHKRWDQLEAFYAAHNRFDEYIRVLERQVDLEDEPTRIVLNTRVAELYRDQLQKPDRALRAYEKVLALDAGNLNAAEALIPLYEAAHDARKLASALEIQLDHTPAREHDLRRERMRHLVELWEHQLRDKPAAFSWALRAFSEATHAGEGGDRWAHEESERLARETGRWQDLVVAYEKAAGAEGTSPQAALPLLQVVAAVNESELANPTHAIEVNQRILEIDENSETAIAALERLYLATGQFPALLQIYERKLALEGGAEAQRGIRYRIASLYEEELKDAGRAIDAYQAILLASGDELPALSALDRIYSETGRWQDLGEILSRELALVDTGDAGAVVDLKFRLGRLREEHLRDVAGAIECHRDLLEIDPAHQGARAELERLLHDPAQSGWRPTVAAILEPIYQTLADWPRLVEVYEIQLSEARDRHERVSLLLRIGELFAMQLADPRKAFDAYSRCFREEPSTPVARSELARLAAELDAWRDLVTLYESTIEDSRRDLDGALRRELLLQLADAFDERLGQSEKAVEFYTRALAIEPDDATALEALEKLYTRHERWPELLETYRRKVDLTLDPSAREALYFRMAQLWEDMLGNIDQAIATYREILGQDDANARALKALDRLFQVKGAWRDLGDNLARQLALTQEQGETVRLLVRLAEVREHQLGEVAAAVDTYRQVLELQSDNVAATEALERLLKQPDQELAAASILEPIYRGRDQWRKLVEVYEIMVRHAPDRLRKIELLHSIGELYELGDEHDMAFNTYARALREDPGMGDTVQRLERMAGAFERWQDLVLIYHDLLTPASYDRDLATSLWTRVADIHEHQLKNDTEAAAAYRKVLETDPSNLDAANSLEAIYLRTESYTQLVELLLQKVGMIDGPAERKALCFRAAQIYEEVLERPEQAIEVYRRVLSIDDSDETAIEALERLYIKLEQWEALKDVYARKAEMAGSVDEKKQMYFVLGQVYDRELKDKSRAIDTYSIVLDLDAEDRQALAALDRLYGETGRFYDLLQILEREVELAQTPAETVGLKYRIGQLWEKELHDLARAIDAYRDTLALDSANDETLAALDGLVHRDGEPVLAAQVLEPLYESAGEWEKLIDVYEVMVKHSDDAFRRVELLHRIADLHERQMARPEQAFKAHGRALRDDPANDTTISSLERLAAYLESLAQERAGAQAGALAAWVELAGLYEEEVRRQTDPVRQVDMLLRLARIYEEEIARFDTQAGVEKAIGSYRRVLEAEPEQHTAMLALDRLYYHSGRWAELADVLRREIRLAATEDESLTLQLRLGQLYEGELKDRDRAIEVYRDILNVDPGHAQTITALELLFAEGTRQVEIAQILEPLYRASEQWRKLVDIQVAELELAKDPRDRLGMLQRIAELCEQKLVDQGGLEAALHYWSQALREAPQSELTGDEVERLARELGAWEDVAGLYAEILESHVRAKGLEEAPQGDEVARQLLLKLARVFEHELRDLSRAEDANLRVLKVDEKDGTALAALDRIYLGAGMAAELAEVLSRRIGITTASDDLVELHLRLGQLNAESLNEPDAAVSAYDAILQIDARNRPALEALEAIYVRRQQWPQLYAVYEKLLDVASGDDELAEYYARMARIAAAAFTESEGAARGRERAADLWNRVIDLRGEEPEALEALANLHREAGSWDSLVDVLERRIRISPTPEEQIPIYAELGRVQRERLGRDREALDAWYQVQSLDPAHLEALRAIAEIHRANQSWEDLVDTIHRTVELPGESVPEVERVELFAELGQVQGEQLLRPQEAIDAWRRVLEYDPADPRAFAALEKLFAQEARWEELVDVLERKIEVLDDRAEKIAALLQVAGVWEEKVGDYTRASDAYERILRMEASNVDASRKLEGIYRAIGSWERLVELLLSRTEHVPAPEKIELFQAMAQVYERELSNREGAFVVLQAAFKEDYSNETTARELERIATQSGKWTDLVSDYTQVVNTISEPKVAADLWVKIGRWYGEHLNHIEYAIASEKQALALQPNHKEALNQLADAYRKTSRWQELVDVLAKHAVVEDDPGKRVELQLSMADLYEGALNDPGMAVRAYREAVAADPACLEALNALERLHRKAGKWQELIDVLGRKAQVIDDGEQVVTIKHQIGALHEEMLDDTSKAIQTYREVLSLDAANVPALKALERLYDKTGQTDAYLENLEQQLDVATSDAERVGIHERQARTFEEKYRKIERACEVLEKILVLDEKHEPTLRTLERLYRQERRFNDLVDTLRRHINVVAENAERIELYAQMGDVYETELKDNDRAIEAFTDILSFEEDHVGALTSLGRLYERIEDWNRAIDVMSRSVQLSDDERLRVEMHYRIGHIQEQRIGDGDAAEARYAEALTIDGAHLPSMAALTNLYQQRGDWLKAAQMMERAAGVSNNLVEKGRLRFEAGRLYRDKLDDESRAIELFAAVLQLNPEHVEAAEPLVELYFREAEAGQTGRWAELEPVLDMLVRKADKHNASELNQLYYRLARTADALGNVDKALKHYRLAYDVDPSFLPTLIGRGALLFKQQDWEGAFKLYQSILVHHGGNQSGEEQVDIYYRLGVIKVKQGERKKALNFFEKALEIDPSHRPTLNAMIDLHSAAGEWDAVVAAKHALMPIADDAERFRLYDETGDIYRERAKNQLKAIEAYNEALSIRPDNHQVLHKVLELYYETRQWQNAVDVLQRFADIEKSPLIRGKYFEAAAKILRDEVHTNEDAIDFFNRALDAYFENPKNLNDQNISGYLKSFESIDRILTAAREWKSQERTYRKMIKRLPAEGFERIKLALWHALGEIYRSRLKDFSAAIQAFQVASKLEPQNAQRREILAELYVLAGPDQAPNAVGEHMYLLKQDPFRIESYRALRRLYMDLRQYDRAWCMCNALVFLQKADNEELAFFEQYRPKGVMKQARQPITDEMWTRLLMHPDEDRYVGAIFGLVWKSVALLRAAEHRQFGLKRKDKLEIATHQALFSKVFLNVAQVLNVPMPEVYLRPDQPGGMQLANCKERNQLIPSLVVGAELLQGRSDKELAFPIAKFLTLMLPQHYLKLTLPTNAELRVAFMAALKLVTKNIPVQGPDAAAVEQYVTYMRNTIGPADQEQLAMVVQRFLATKAEINLSKWAQAAELTSYRAGFVITNDLALSARFVQLEPTVVGGLQPKDRIKELVLFAISEKYFELRQQLGLTIG